MAILLWSVAPYAVLTCFVVGHLLRWRHDQFGWRTLSTPLVENRLLRKGSPLVHLGAAAVFAGHLLGLLVPRSWTAGIGITDPVYRAISVTAGTLAGTALLTGLILLAARRIAHPPTRRTSTVMDLIMYATLLIVAALGVWATVGMNVFGAGYDYRETVAVWFRGVLVLRPDPSLMSGAPLLLQLHTAVGLGLVAIWPFTRLVHTWAVPIAVLRDPAPPSSS